MRFILKETEMLVLSRREQEVVEIRCGEEVMEVAVVSIERGRVELGFTFPKDYKITRKTPLRKRDQK